MAVRRCTSAFVASLAMSGSNCRMAACSVLAASFGWPLTRHPWRNDTTFVQLQGTAGFRVHFTAGTEEGISGNIKQNFLIPVDAAWPIVGLPVPLSVVVRQTLRVETIFTARSRTLDATGEY